MAGLLRRLWSRVFPKRVDERFELELVRPEALAYQLRPTIAVDGRQVPSPRVSASGKLVLDGTTYRLSRESLDARERLRHRLRRPESGVEPLFSGTEEEEQLRTLLAASPEISVPSSARALLDRPEAPFTFDLDFDSERGDMLLSVKLAGDAFSLPDKSMGPVVSVGERWYSVTSSQREILDRVVQSNPKRSEGGQYRLSAALTPELLPELRERADVETSPAAEGVSVTNTSAVPTFELAESDDGSLLVSPKLELAPDSVLFDTADVIPVTENWQRAGSNYFRTPEVSDETFQRFSDTGYRRMAVAPGNVPDFLSGPPSGPSEVVRKRWVGPALEVDAKPAEAFVSADLDAAGALQRSGWLADGEGKTLMPLQELPAGSHWVRSDRRFIRVPDERSLSSIRKESGALAGDDEIADFLIEREKTSERKRQIRLGARAKEIRIDPLPAGAITAALDFNEGDNTVRARVGYQGGALTISQSVVRSLPPGQRYVRQGDRFQRIDRPALARVERIAEQLGGVETDEGFSFPAYLFEEVISQFSGLGFLEKGELFKKWLERLADFDQIEPVPLPSALRAEWQPRMSDGRAIGIRTYQQKGYHWLTFLKKYGFGGVLADEMGLGKTVQVLMAIARSKEQHGRWCSLVITAKSALGHWEKDARTFFDGLAVRRWADLQRSIAAARPGTVEQGYDVLIVNYERVRSDIEFLDKLRFRFVIMDEAQRTKNPESQTHRAVRRLRAETKISVTATPVETRLRDLWSLFDIMMRGKLGTEGQFVARYEPRKNLEDLSRRIRPFLLSRKKSMPEIELQLPGKSYRDRDCEMSQEQRKLYDSIRSGGRAYVLEATRSKPSGDLHIFELLLRLQQICLHPALVYGGDTSASRSGKASAVLELLGELLEEPENRILVFSRFVEAISLLQSWSQGLLERTGVSSFALIGATDSKSREEMIELFNSRTSRDRIMFVSLRAGGVGVNLQAANHVVHFDRWWNPAVEWQAEDRAYRMNSQRPVTVHRITTLDSIEERIAAVLEGRASLVRDVMDPQTAIEKLVTREELLRIFGVTGSLGH